MQEKILPQNFVRHDADFFEVVLEFAVQHSGLSKDASGEKSTGGDGSGDEFLRGTRLTAAFSCRIDCLLLIFA